MEGGGAKGGVAKGGVGIVSIERPEGWIIELARFHGPNVVTCKIVKGNIWTPVIRAPDNPTINSSTVIYDSNCSHKPRGTSKPTFPLQRVICPQSRQSATYRIATHNFTNNDLTNGKSPSYQSLVNIPPAPLCAPLRPVTEDTPVPATRTLSSVPVFPAEPALFIFLHTKKMRSPSVKTSTS